MMDGYQLISLVIVLTASFAFINSRFLKLPSSIGIMLLSLVFSVLMVLSGNLFPHLSSSIIRPLQSIRFGELLMNFMLSFLLFAGAINIDSQRLKRHRLSILLLASVGVLISTFIIGTVLYFIFELLHERVNFIYCLLFGALISPTDPVAALGILRKANIPKSFQIKIVGESLFNDGFAIVVFLTLLSVAKAGIDNFSAWNLLILFIKETGGGLLFGAVLGYGGYLMLRSINNYEVEVQITLAIVTGGYVLADSLFVSAPIAIAMAGIIIGSKTKKAVSEETQDYLEKFWEIIDVTLNSVLFLLIGIEMLLITVNSSLILIGCIMMIIVLGARYVSVLIPFSILHWFLSFEKHTVSILTWGALRGGISVAVALSLPLEMHRNEFLTITYIVVVFSILIQGLTIEKFVKKLL